MVFVSWVLLLLNSSGIESSSASVVSTASAIVFIC
jgi:hypothetical protein